MSESFGKTTFVDGASTVVAKADLTDTVSSIDEVAGLATDAKAAVDALSSLVTAVGGSVTAVDAHVDAAIVDLAATDVHLDAADAVIDGMLAVELLRLGAMQAEDPWSAQNVTDVSDISIHLGDLITRIIHLKAHTAAADVSCDDAIVDLGAITTATGTLGSGVTAASDLVTTGALSGENVADKTAAARTKAVRLAAL